MGTKHPLVAAGTAALAALTLVAGVASADITLEHKIALQGVGMMAAGNMTGTTKTTISGDRSRTDSDIQLQSRLVRMLAHGAVGPTAEIIRLDADKIDRLDFNRKQYTEQTFEEMKARLQKALDKSQQSQDQQGQGNQENPKPMDDSKCEWLDPKVDVRRPGDKGTYAGYDAERLTIVASQPCKDKETGAICEVALALDEWLAPSLTASAEAEKFHRAYAQKLGLDLTTGRGGAGGGDFNQRAQAMFGRYQGIWNEVLAKTKDVKGYPVKSSFAFAFGGPQCKNTQTPPPSSDDSSGSSSSGGGGLAGQVAGKLGSMFHHKKDDSQAAAAAPADALALPDGLIPIVTLSSELVSVSTDSVSASVFEVPADFKKAEPRGPKT